MLEMTETPSQARFNKLKLIYERANDERNADLDHQQEMRDSEADLLPTLELPDKQKNWMEILTKIRGVRST